MPRGRIFLPILGMICLMMPAFSQTNVFSKNPLAVRPQNRITRSIEDQERVALIGNRLPFARAANDIGAVSENQAMEKMVLVLQADPAQQQALELLLAQQRDPSSSLYQRWLTPEEYSKRFGVSDQDLSQVITWMERHGLQVDDIPAGRRSIIFSGSASQVESAFHTQIRRFRINGELHTANATDPEIPQALASVVRGIASLHDFHSSPMHSSSNLAATPQYTSGNGAHYIAPGDLATIYNVNALYNQGYDGSGQSIAIVGRSNIYLSDVRAFRSTFGLPTNDPLVIVPTTDPGTANSGDVGEAMLDVEWAGAMAKKATIKYVAAKSTYSTDGVALSSQYIVSNNLAPIMSVSYGLCERLMGSSQTSFYNGLWQQAAAQGISVFVSSGDSGAAGCDASSATAGTGGRGVNGLCSSPYSTCVGGTQFNDAASPSQYWGATNSNTLSSALKYIPEKVWNESGSTGLWSSGGGTSTLFTKPAWQNAVGVPSDGMRDVPDVSLTASSHDGYLVRMNGNLYIFGGTSASSPTFASMMAFVLQKMNARQGNVNPTLYSLANLQQLSGGAAVFHDVVTGSNTVPGVTGFNAGTGYDLATGLGSVDAEQLVLHWSDAGTAPSLSIAAAVSSLSVPAAGNNTIGITTAASNGFNGAVTFSASQLPTGVTAAFTPGSLAAPGSGTTTLKLTASAASLAGTYEIKISATSLGYTTSTNISLTVLPAPTFSLSSTTTAMSLLPGSSGSTTIATSPNSTFNAIISLKVTGMPAGMTATLSPASITAPGSGSSILAVATTSTVAAGFYNLNVTATGGGLTKTTLINVSVPGFTLTTANTTLSLNQGLSNSVVLTTALLGGFNSPVNFSVSGLPAGVTAAFSPAALSAPGAGRSVLTLTAASSASLGTATVMITAVGAGVSRTIPLSLTVLPPPTFTLTTPAVVNLLTGGTISVAFKTTAFYGYSSNVQWSVSGVPAGVTAKLSTPSSAVGATVTLTLSATANASPGVFALVIQASGGGVTKTASMNLALSIPAVYTMTSAVSSLILPPGTSGSTTIKTEPTVTFNAPISFRIAGLPTGMTASFSPATLSAPGTGTVTVIIASGATVSPGSYLLTVTATGGNVTQTSVITVVVPGFTVTGIPTSLRISRGKTLTFSITSKAVAGFSAPICLSATGFTTGVSLTFSANTIAAPGNGTAIVTVAVGTNAPIGNSTFQINASGGSQTRSAIAALTIQ